MDILSDEHEREEVVRKWWHEHWKPITLGIVIALAGLVGVRQYQAWQLEKSQETAYEVYQLQTQLESRGVAALDTARQFVEEHNDVYAAILALDMARVELAASRYDDAQKSVAIAQKNGGDLLFAQTGLISARLLAQTGKTEEALQVLNGISSEAYVAEVAECRGDVLRLQGDTQGAHDAYLKALQHLQANDLTINPVLQMKFDSVIVEGDTPAYTLMADQVAKARAEEAALIQQ